jgi:hypothetical protein
MEVDVWLEVEPFEFYIDLVNVLKKLVANWAHIGDL